MRKRCPEYMMTQTPDTAHVHHETLRSVRCNGSTVANCEFTKLMNTIMLPIAMTAAKPALRTCDARSRIRSR